MATHTPGPWRHVSAGMVEMGDPESRLSFWAGLGRGGQLPNPSGQDPCEEAEANARLIAAAPDLLEALTELVQWQAFCHPDVASAFADARAAISRATGEQP